MTYTKSEQEVLSSVDEIGDLAYPTGEARAVLCHAAVFLAKALREREALIEKFRDAVIEMEKSGEKIINECFQYRHGDRKLKKAIDAWDILVKRLKTEKINALTPPPPSEQEKEKI